MLASHGDVRRLRAVTAAGDDGLARTFRRAGLSFRTLHRAGATVLECGLPQSVAATGRMPLTLAPADLTPRQIPG